MNSEFHRMVAEAAAGKSKHQQMRSTARVHRKDGAGSGAATPKEKPVGAAPGAVPV